MNILTFDEFLRSVKQNKDITHSLFLGAGASVESGIQTASDCIWDWKRDIYLSQNPNDAKTCNNVRIDSVQRIIQRWIDNQGEFPVLNADNEYSFFAEKAYPIDDDRRKYFQHLCESKHPSLGYHLLAMLAEIGFVKSIWTTNFDGLSVKIAHQYNLTPIEVTLESQQRIFRATASNELLCIALHGDYKYGPIKNVASELDAQSEVLISALKQELSQRNLIVMGYSGRDHSIMKALMEAYSQPGTGRLYWCGYGEKYSTEVENLLNFITSQGRTAFYIPTDGFDKTMLLLSKYCMGDNPSFISNVDKLINEIGKNNNDLSAPFVQYKGDITGLVKTNLYPIVFPKTCYQFKFKVDNSEREWHFCKNLEKYGIIAIPSAGFVYAWGDKATIIRSCRDHIDGNISITAFSRDLVMSNRSFQEMLLRGITATIAKKLNYGFSKDKIWDTTSEKVFSFKIGENQICAYYGVKLSLKFDFKYTYLSFEPAYHFCDDTEYDENTLKFFAEAFSTLVNGKSPNLNVNNYIDKWAKTLLGNDTFIGHIPFTSTGEFEFKVKANSILIGTINKSNRYKLQLPSTINSKRIVLNGIECKDPDLLFYNTSQNSMCTDFHPMRGLVTNSPYDLAFGSKIPRNSINLGVICPVNYSIEFREFLSEINNRHSVQFNTDYVIPFPGFFNAFDTGLNVPLTSESNWAEIKPPFNSDQTLAINEFRESILRQIDNLSSNGADVIVIYIPNEHEIFTMQDNYDLHDIVKAYAAQKNIATQFIREKTIESNLQCQIMWALSLAIYVKSCHVPWVVSAMRPDTAFAGIGYSINKSKNGTNIVVGCSHLYSADGQGLKYKLSKLKDFYLDKRNNPFLTEDEAYKLGLNIKELFYKSFTELPKRVVIHKRTPFKKEEVDGLVKCLSSAGISDIQLLEINYEDGAMSFAYDKNFDIDKFPVRRGLCFPINGNTMLLYTHGIAPSVRNPFFKYIQGGKTVPIPLKIVNHYGSGDMVQIATEILGLSKMNWNSFGLYSKLPCTIESSNQLARIGWLLSQYEGTIYDYRFFM